MTKMFLKSYSIIIVVIIVFSFSCKEKKVVQNRKRISENQSNKDTTGFLNNCNEITDLAMYGGLQGYKQNNDSTKGLIFYECFKCKETFEIIFVRKGSVSERIKIDSDSLMNTFKAGCSNNFEQFRCYCFVYPQVDPDKQKNEHALNVYFPLKIKVYKKANNDTWDFIQSSTITKFEDLSRIQFHSIYYN